jgi:hypothetical protein
VTLLRSIPLALVALVLASAAALSACSTGAGTAITVNGVSLSNRDFQQRLALIAADGTYAKAAFTDSSTGAAISLHGANSSTYSTDFTTQVLDQQVAFTVAAQEVARRHLSVTDSDRSSIESQLASSLSGSSGSTSPAQGSSSADGQAALDKLGAYKAVLVAGYANEVALQKDIGKKLSTDAQLRQTFEKTKSQYTNRACVSVIAIEAGTGPTQDASGNLVAPSDSDMAAALAKANTIESQLKAGADFATTAKSSSSDATSGAKGGDVGCVPSGAFAQNQFPELDTAAFGQPVGTVGAPIKTVYGYFIMKVTARGDLTFEQAKSSVQQGVQTQAQSDAADLITGQGKKAKVAVDPQWGSWDPKTGSIKAPVGATSTTTSTAKPSGSPGSTIGLGSSGTGAGTGSGATGSSDTSGGSSTPTSGG